MELGLNSILINYSQISLGAKRSLVVTKKGVELQLGSKIEAKLKLDSWCFFFCYNRASIGIERNLVLTKKKKPIQISTLVFFAFAKLFLVWRKVQQKKKEKTKLQLGYGIGAKLELGFCFFWLQSSFFQHQEKLKCSKKILELA